jgi:hypothetical protein
VSKRSNSTSDLLKRMWFDPITAQDPFWRAATPYEPIWLSVEAEVPMVDLMTIELKKDGYQPLYLQEVDEGMTTAIVSTVMEV